MKTKFLFLLLACFLSTGTLLAQQQPKNWFNLDIDKDSVFGVSTERAYNELLKGRESKTVIVAVIDDGTDPLHEDLKDIIWVNEDEVPNNGIDDDKNGYVDDVHGWNFIGGKDGDVSDDTYEVTRLFAKYSKKFADVDVKKLSKEDKKEYEIYINKVKPAFYEGYYTNARSYFRMSEIVAGIDKVVADLKGEVTVENLKAYKAKGYGEEFAVKNLITFVGSYGMTVEDTKAYFVQLVENSKETVSKQLNISFNPRTVVGDDYNDPNQRNYGNNNYKGPSGSGDHGTHVAGIIGAVRNNNIGMNGVADNVRIMIVRVVPNGDERDKDIANGIRYAVDNGATVINMSFGKKFSPYKQTVDEAVQYAAEKDVLLVHGAGNDAEDIDKIIHYPYDVYEKGGVAKNWLEVGAISWTNDSNITAEFSNYGKKNVDVFAPGVQINSTIPNNKYANFSGTSMASPVTAGVAALIRSYFPALTAVQVKEVIMKSVVPITYPVNLPGEENNVNFKNLCVSGGVVNAYKAIELATKTKGKKK